MISLRQAKEKDIPVIRHLAYRIWPVAYRHILNSTQIQYMLEKMYNEVELLGQMQQGHTFLIAEEQDTGIGFAGFSLSNATAGTYKLHKLYVLPGRQGKGTGKLLISEVIRLVRQAGGRSLELNVNRNNDALQFYKKAGFIVRQSVDIDIGQGYFMNDYVMEKKL